MVVENGQQERSKYIVFSLSLNLWLVHILSIPMINVHIIECSPCFVLHGLKNGKFIQKRKKKKNLIVNFN